MTRSTTWEDALGVAGMNCATKCRTLQRCGAPQPLAISSGRSVSIRDKSRIKRLRDGRIMAGCRKI